jgi:hypothetical protein
MTSEWSISVCGLNCAKCDIYQAGHGNEKLRNEIVEFFKKERHKTVKPEQIKCEGCRGPRDSHWSEDCEMLSCAQRKKVEYCFQCTVFPCVLLEKFASDGASHHKRTVENLKQMRKMGVDAWVAEQQRKGLSVFCP